MALAEMLLDGAAPPKRGPIEQAIGSYERAYGPRHRVLEEPRRLVDHATQALAATAK